MAAPPEFPLFSSVGFIATAYQPKAPAVQHCRALSFMQQLPCRFDHKSKQSEQWK
jgi:hypothetical protein